MAEPFGLDGCVCARRHHDQIFAAGIDANKSSSGRCLDVAHKREIDPGFAQNGKRFARSGIRPHSPCILKTLYAPEQNKR